MGANEPDGVDAAAVLVGAEPGGAGVAVPAGVPLAEPHVPDRGRPGIRTGTSLSRMDRFLDSYHDLGDGKKLTLVSAVRKWYGELLHITNDL